MRLKKQEYKQITTSLTAINPIIVGNMKKMCFVNESGIFNSGKDNETITILHKKGTYGKRKTYRRQ